MSQTFCHNFTKTSCNCTWQTGWLYPECDTG